MTPKRGQITVFIIIGIAILVVVGALFYFRGRGAAPSISEEVTIDTSSLNAFVSSCAKQTAQDAVVYTGLRGGVEPALDDNFAYIDYPVHYYFVEGEDKRPSEELIKASLNYYMENNLHKCTTDFDAFKKQGFNIEEGIVRSNVTIAEEEVIFDLDYPVTAVKGGSRETEERFSANVNVNLPKMTRIIDEYIEAQKEKPDQHRILDLLRILDENDVIARSYQGPRGIVVMSIVDNNQIINNEPLAYSFAIKYNWMSPE